MKSCNLSILSVIAFLIFPVFGLYAQTRDITGTVVDPDGMPVIGAGVFCKGKENIGTTTDEEGKFLIAVPDGVTALKFSSLGMSGTEYMIPAKLPPGGGNHPDEIRGQHP